MSDNGAYFIRLDSQERMWCVQVLFKNKDDADILALPAEYPVFSHLAPIFINSNLLHEEIPSGSLHPLRFQL